MRRSLLGKLIIISLGLHLMACFYLGMTWSRETVTPIELSLAEVPVARSIPRPRIQPKKYAREKAFTTSAKMPLPTRMDIRPAKADFVDTGAIETPLGVHETAPPSLSSQILSSEDYFEMVRLRIEGAKRYPEEAQQSGIEGRVRLEIVITSTGDISSLSIIRGSGKAVLDKAAKEAVICAAPFPSPQGIFDGPLTFVISISFELT